MILPILIYGNEVLRRPCLEVEREMKDLSQLIADMFETMREADGVGLSANQVGRSLRLFVCNVEDFAEDLGDNLPSGDPWRRVFINPTIVETAGIEEPYREGCLSLPGINENVTRPSVVTLRYWDENWVEHCDCFDHFWARVIQHEYDHISGKLFSDHLAPIRRSMLKSKLAALTRGSFKANYRCQL
ncbi:MAG: peptide deformylase [Mucinivorans sp.]